MLKIDDKKFRVSGSGLLHPESTINVALSHYGIVIEVKIGNPKKTKTVNLFKDTSLLVYQPSKLS